MLFVKNMVFLDGAIATLAPDLDLLAEIADDLDVLRRRRHGERIGRRARHRPRGLASSTSTASRARFGVDPDTTQSLTYREAAAP